MINCSFLNVNFVIIHLFFILSFFGDYKKKFMLSFMKYPFFWQNKRGF